jgi:hypothetical protein
MSRYDVIGAKLGVIALALVASAAGAETAAPIYDPVTLNVGVSCQWQQTCQRRQMKAMVAARKYMAAKNPSLAKIHLCNRNARRGTAKVDWIGFNDCIRNPHLLPRQGRR